MAPVRKRKKKSKNYFTQETEDYIVKYNNLDSIEDEELRSKIYEKHIHYPFFKLTQNIILFF
jgi:ribosomal protein L10